MGTCILSISALVVSCQQRNIMYCSGKAFSSACEIGHKFSFPWLYSNADLALGSEGSKNMQTKGISNGTGFLSSL